MLKKAGFIVVAATAGLLAVSPLAFAGEYAGAHGGEHGHSDNGGHHGHDGDHGDNGGHRVGGCEFGDQAAANSIEQDSEAGNQMSLTGAVTGGAANEGTVNNSQSQAPVGSCNTVTDLVNVSIEDNDDSTEIDDSGNTTTTETATSILGILGLA